jgi:Hint module
VVYIPHKRNKQSALFTHITTESGRDVKMTRNHILPSGVCGSSPMPLIHASEVKAGNCIMTVSGEEKVYMVEKIQGEGVYTIVTNEEYIVVNGIIASPFGANHMMANMYYNIHRFLYTISPTLLASTFLHSTNEGLGIVVPLFGSV